MARTRSIQCMWWLVAVVVGVVLSTTGSATALGSDESARPAAAANPAAVRDCYLFYDFPSIETNVSCRLAKKVAKTGMERYWEDGVEVTRTRGFRCEVKASSFMVCRDGKRFVRYDARE